METEEEQTNLLAQHEKAIQMTRSYHVENENGELSHNNPTSVKTGLLQIRPKNDSVRVKIKFSLLRI